MAANKRIGIEVAVETTGDKDLDRLLKALRDAGQDVAPFEAAAKRLGSELQALQQQQGLITEFTQLKQASVTAADGLDQAQKKAQQLGRELAQTAEPTQQQKINFERAKTAVNDAKQAYQQITSQLSQTRAAMAEIGIETKGLSKQQAQLNKDTKEAQAELEKNAAAIRGAAEKVKQLETNTKAQAAASTTAAKATNAHTASIKKMEDGTEALASKLGTLQNTIATVFGVQIGTGLLSDLAKTADAYNNLSARIKISTGEGAAFEAAMAGVQRVAVATRSSLEETAGLYTRIAEAGKTLKLSQDQVLGLVQTINQTIQISGGSAESAQAAIVQLNQALQSGVLRGEEFNSVMEQSPRLAKALADGLGVNIGKLREMAEAGRLTTDVVIAALRGQSEAVEKEFAKLPATVGGALQNLSTAWTVYIGESDKATGASAAAASAINALSTNLREVAGFLLDAGQAAAALFALKMAQSFLGIGQAAAASGADIATNTLATNNNSKAATDNALATKNNAAAQKEHADAARQDAAATDADTAATNRNTKATNDNALGTRATGNIMQSYSGALKEAADAKDKAAQGSGLLSKAMGTLGDAAKGVMGFLGGPLGLVTLTAMYAEDIGKLAGRFSLWATGQKSLEQSTKELTAAQEKEAAAAKAVAEAREKQAAADKAAGEAKFGLNERAKELIAQFDDLVKKGDSASDAISKIGKDFDLSTQPGIQAAAGVLDKLVADGKITSQQFSDAWAQALDGQDLAKFETNFRAMLLNLQVAADKAGKEVEAALARGASDEVVKALRLKAEQAAQAVQEAGKRMATMFDVTLNEAIRRTGLDMDLLATGMGKASISAINDVDKLVGSLDQLKEKGLDTSRILSASLSKAIDTADGQKALDLVKQKIEEVRKVLGDKIADGLLDQLADKADTLNNEMDQLVPGIQSVEEAMKVLGLTSDYTLGVMADRAQKAYEAIKNSGTASAREIGEAFKAAAEATIAANNGIAPEWVKSQAAARGYKVEVDDVGKATLKTASAHSDLSVALAKSTAAIQAKAAAMKAESDLALSGLNLTKSSLEASLKIAEAQGNEKEAIRLKIEIKRVEIQIIQETVKAQIAEAEGSIAVAKAKMAELQATGQLNPEKRAELEAQIKIGQAKINEAKARGESVRVLEQEIKALQGSTSGYNNNANSIDKTTAALEKLNAEKEREIAALKKSNELKEQELELYRQKWKIDKEGFSVDANGNRIQQTMDNVTSLTNKAMDAGLSATQAQALANKYKPNEKTGMFDSNAFWKELNELKIKAAADAENLAKLQKKASEGTLSSRELFEAQRLGIASPAPAPRPAPVPAPTPAPRPAPPAPRPQQAPTGGQGGSMAITSAPTYVSNYTLPAVGRATAKFDTESDQAQMDKLIRALSSAAGVAQ